MWVLGVLCCTAGSFFIALGLVLQKYSHQKERGGGTSIYFQPWWVLGFSIYLAGQVLNFIAMAWAPQAMLSALGASSLVFLGVLAWIIAGENMQRLEMLALACVVTGVIMVILAVPEAEGDHRHPVRLVTGSLAEADFIITAVAFAALIFLAWVSITLLVPGLTTARGMFWTLVTGVLAGYSFTLCKCVSMLLINTRHTWVHWQLYVIVLFVAAMCLSQVHALNLALSMGSAKAVVPLTFALGVLVQIMNAQVAFEELSAMSRHAVFWIGILLVLVSIACTVQLQLSADEEEVPFGEGEPTSPYQSESQGGLADEEAMRRRRTETPFVSGPTGMSLARRGRRHSSYFGLRPTSACRGHVFPLGSGGLVVIT